MAKPHEFHQDMMNAFDKADRNTPRDGLGRASYEMAASTGMPRSPAQMQSVKKAAAKSALTRGERAKAIVPAAPAAPKPGLSTGGVSLAKPKGTLSLASKPKGGLLGV